jgi:hypothetical protein
MEDYPKILTPDFQFLPEEKVGLLTYGEIEEKFELLNFGTILKEFYRVEPTFRYLDRNSI